MEKKGETKFKVNQYVKLNRDPNTTRRVLRIVYHEALQKHVYYLTPSDSPQDYWFADELFETKLD
jgi:hypothetical protein